MTNKKKYLKLFIILFTLFMILKPSIKIEGSEVKPGVYVNPIMSGLPILDNSGYFKLIVEDNRHYRVYLSIVNNTNKSMVVKTVVKNARTANDGNIVYDDSSLEKNKILSKLVDKNLKEYKLKPLTNKIIHYDFYTGDNQIHGTQLGGIITTFYYKSNDNINNIVSYVNGISFTEKKTKSNLNDLEIKSLDYVKKDKMYSLRIKNNSLNVFRNISIKITSSNNALNKNFRNVSITPHGTFNLNIKSENSKIRLKDLSVLVNNNYNLNKAEKFNIIKNYYIVLLLTILLVVILIWKG